MQIVGIINCTPDSFYDGGRYATTEAAIAQGHALITEGANWLDIGGESTRPGAQDVSVEEELRRVIPVLEALSPLIPTAIDTRKPLVARAALEAGAQMINDVNGFRDPHMCTVAANSSALCCIVHAQGTPQTMQINPHYPEGVVTEIMRFFTETLEKLETLGIPRSRLLLDPGIGFGKSIADNLTILNHLKDFTAHGCPLYLGLSRKSFLQKLLGKEARETLPATLICATVAVQHHVAYLRVHDVGAHCEMLSLLEHINLTGFA